MGSFFRNDFSTRYAPDAHISSAPPPAHTPPPFLPLPPSRLRPQTLNCRSSTAGMQSTTFSEPLSPDFARTSSLPDDKKDYSDDLVASLQPDAQHVQSPVRPPIDYSSAGAFTRSIWRRFVSLWTKRFILSLLAGQLVSLCITCTNVTTTELVNRNWSLPTTQTFFLCASAPHPSFCIG
jgi:hypothetical protein